MPVTEFLCCRSRCRGTTAPPVAVVCTLPGMRMQRSATIVVSMYVERETVQNNTATGAR